MCFCNENSPECEKMWNECNFRENNKVLYFLHVKLFNFKIKLKKQQQKSGEKTLENVYVFVETWCWTCQTTTWIESREESAEKMGKSSTKNEGQKMRD